MTKRILDCFICVMLKYKPILIAHRKWYILIFFHEENTWLILLVSAEEHRLYVRCVSKCSVHRLLFAIQSPLVGSLGIFAFWLLWCAVIFVCIFWVCIFICHHPWHTFSSSYFPFALTPSLYMCIVHLLTICVFVSHLNLFMECDGV